MGKGIWKPIFVEPPTEHCRMYLIPLVALRRLYGLITGIDFRA